MNEFVYAQPVKIWFGEGKFEALGTVLDELGLKRCVIACGRHFAPAARALMETEPRLAAVYGEVEQNPQLSGAIETAKLARAFDADAVIGVGGGSSLDTAKFAAAIARGDGDPLAYYRGELPLPSDPLAVIAVPTTAGTGSEVTQVAVISHGDEKRSINQPAFMPKAAIVDPLLMLSVPPRTTMNTGLDAMAHALEGYWNINHQPICDIMAVEAVRLILGNLETAFRDGENREARANMALASTIAGLAFSQPRTAGCHAASYPLSEHYHLPHGEACAFTLDHFVRLNADARLEELCRRVGLSGTAELADRIAAYKQMAGLRTRLADLGDHVDIDVLARESAAHVLMSFNPVPMDAAAMRAFFEQLR